MAREAGAHFTFFVSGVYLLDPARKQLYDAPRRGRGESDIGFANGAGDAEPRQNVIDVLGQIRQAAAEGHEFGTHFGGHFCGKRGVSTWNAADWASEIDQSRSLLVHASANNELEPPLPVPFAERDIVGDRTPCLEGKLDVLYPVLRAKGFRYDASRASPPGAWPARMDGIWSFPLPLIHLVGPPLQRAGDGLQHVRQPVRRRLGGRAQGTALRALRARLVPALLPLDVHRRAGADLDRQPLRGLESTAPTRTRSSSSCWPPARSPRWPASRTASSPTGSTRCRRRRCSSTGTGASSTRSGFPRDPTGYDDGDELPPDLRALIEGVRGLSWKPVLLHLRVHARVRCLGGSCARARRSGCSRCSRSRF